MTLERKSGDLALAMGGRSVGNPMLAKASRAVLVSVMSSTNFSPPPQGQAEALTERTRFNSVAQSILQTGLHRGSPSRLHVT